MIYTDISRKRLYEGTVCEISSELDEKHSAKNLLKEEGFWSSKRHHSIQEDRFVIDYGEVLPVNFVEIVPSPSRERFPAGFRIEASSDGTSWKILHFEKEFRLDLFPTFRIDFPISFVRYLKVFIIRPRPEEGRFVTEIGRLLAGISGFRELTCGGAVSYDHEISRVLDGKGDTYWESRHRQKAEHEVIGIDLGTVSQINRISLMTAAKTPHAFPEHFLVECSTDRSIWTTVIEEVSFASEPSRLYYWEFQATPARFMQITMHDVKLEDNTWGSRLAGIDLSAAYVNPYHTHNIGEITPYASVFNAGIVRLAKDGEDTFGTAVQGSDRRLRDASTIFKGIIQLADDREAAEGLAVQASDTRLQPASEFRAGIVRLAYDREEKPGAVVQSNDSRLTEATVTGYGITKLCPDGVYSENSVVVGNDSRLKPATAKSSGIVRLAADGENAPECAVQGNDRRLRDATVMYPGIVELAEDGENRAGVAVQGDDRRLRDATVSAKGIVELAEDGEDREGVAVQGSDRRLRDATVSAKGIVELAEDGEDRAGVAVQGSDCRLKDATVSAKGIVRLAEDGEDAPGVAVQGSDRRLRDASELVKGILRFARDGETSEFAAVQSIDRRLRDATTLYPGIVELAEDGEDAPGVAVQASDKRLRDATTLAKGIVELAEDGEDRPGVVVQGNDARLRDAGEKRRGIMRFASDGESAPMAAVQASDKRLRDATTLAKGIVELAEDGEDAPGVAVQGNDRRLRDATTLAKGIVELAEDGEDAPGVAVQGSDKRLQPASEVSSGIVRFASEGESRRGFAVQSDDPRLSDKRAPLPHEHPYALLRHEFNSHTGTISVSGEGSERFNGIVNPPESASTVYGKNASANPGAIGVAGVTEMSAGVRDHQYGVLGHSQFVGVRGQSIGNTGDGAGRGAGVLGVSRFGAGGVFASEHSWSLVADGNGQIAAFDDSPRLSGNGDALLVHGNSEFNGSIRVANGGKGRGYPSNIVELFEVDEQEFISVGDLLVVSEKGGSVLSRSRTSYSRAVIGVVSGNPAVTIDNTGRQDKLYPVTLAGKVMCKVDARSAPVSPGDLIVASETPGCGMAGKIDSFDKTGSVIGKALDGLADGIGTIPVFVFHA